MDIHDVSKVPRYVELLKTQKKTLQDAQSLKGQFPEKKATRDELIMAHLFCHLSGLQVQPRERVRIQISYLAPPYPPSTVPLSGLKKVMIKDLVLETHHRGTYVILRAITQTIRMTALLAVVEDENEDVVALHLYHQDSSRHPGDILDDKGVLIVKEPYLKTTADGQISIRVDHLSDVIFLHKFNERIPEAWRQSPPEAEDKERDPHIWRMRGHYFFKQGKYQFAIEWCV